MFDFEGPHCVETENVRNAWERLCRIRGGIARDVSASVLYREFDVQDAAKLEYLLDPFCSGRLAIAQFIQTVAPYCEADDDPFLKSMGFKLFGGCDDGRKCIALPWKY